ncbi:hypothetical protein ACHAXR_007258, partial [Thalassiosira sp. AJA248-18]
CKKRAAEIFDEALFKQPPRKDECPICLLPLPLIAKEIHYKSCCGKTICYGCLYAHARASTDQICPFCRTPDSTSLDEDIERIKERVEDNDGIAMLYLGGQYRYGSGVPQDSNKALELWHQAVKLNGCAESHCRIASAYARGEIVEMDVKKAKYHWELGAMGGNVEARHSLGTFEMMSGNINRAMKHLMISAEFGWDDSLKEIQNGFSEGYVTKDEFEKALRAHKESKDGMQSDQRDAAQRDIFTGSEPT